jgi:hypothetical protein
MGAPALSPRRLAGAMRRLAAPLALLVVVVRPAQLLGELLEVLVQVVAYAAACVLLLAIAHRRLLFRDPV